MACPRVQGSDDALSAARRLGRGHRPPRPLDPGPTLTERTLGGVPVLDVKPKGWRESGRVLVYTHGGAYAYFSARSTLSSSVVAADATGLRVVSVDYTVAPAGKWERVTDEVLAV